MPNFIYKAKDASTGKVEISKLEANSKDELVNLLHDKNKIVISISEAKISTSKPEPLFSFKGFSFKVSLKEKINFCSQLAALLESGITLVRALDVLSQQAGTRKFKIVILKVREDIKKGIALHKAFARQPNIFSPLWVNLVETGEASGELPFVLKELASYFQLSSDIKSKLTTALIYPSIVILAATAAMAVFVTFLIPMFEQLFETFNTPLPALTIMVVKMSSFLRDNILYILGVLVIFTFILCKYFSTKSGKKIFDRIKLSTPIFGDFFLKIAMVRFANSLSVLMKGGVPILYSLEVVKKTISNTVVADIIENVKNDIRGGKEMAASLGKNALVPPIVIQMIQVGEETGELGTMFERLTNFYREQVDTFVARFSTIIEPAMILIVGGIVAFLVLSMFLPVFMRASLGGL